MATRNGKVANLPNDIREQLNLRLLEGVTARELAAWLNALPAVQSILGSQFDGAPISEVTLTHWRQGGYLQWLPARECFDSARALADVDGNLAKTGLSAERLLNILTLRYSELLMRWDLPSDESTSESGALTAMARKARILQGISRSVLAIHRIQSQSPREKSERARSSVNSHARPKENARATPAAPELQTEASRVLAVERKGVRQSEIPPTLSGMITPTSISSNLAHTASKAHPDLSELLQAV